MIALTYKNSYIYKIDKCDFINIFLHILNRVRSFDGDLDK